MSAPPWLLLAFDAALPELVGAQRDALAERICDHLPGEDIARAIAESARSVLATRGISAPELVAEIGANAAQAVLATLGDEPDLEDVTGGAA